MSSTLVGQRIAAVRRLPVPWLTVGTLAVVMAAVDTFWLTSLQGAIGAIERSQGPFNHWLRGWVVMVPLFAVVIVWVLSRTGRRYGDAPRGTRATVAIALLVAAAGTVLGLGQATISAATDYQLQTTLLQVQKPHHFHADAAGRLNVPQIGNCDAVCLEKRATLSAHVKGMAYVGALEAGSNLLLVGWVLAARGAGWAPSRRAGRKLDRQGAGAASASATV